MDAIFDKYATLLCDCNVENLENFIMSTPMRTYKPRVVINALLISACQEGDDALAKRLIQEKDAAVNAQYQSKSAVMWAMFGRSNNESKVKKLLLLLVQHHANVNAGNSDGFTPFMVACSKGYADVAKLLLEHIYLDAVDCNGCSALFYAITTKRHDIVKLLIEAGADQAIPNAMGYTPAKWAARLGFYDLVKEMQQTNQLWFGTLPEHAPNLFEQLQVAEYFEQVCSILQQLNLEDQIKYFAKWRISYYGLLIMSYKKLRQIGVTSYDKRSRIIKYIDAYNWHLPLKSDEPIESFKLVGNESLQKILSKLNDYQYKLLTKQAATKYALENREQIEVLSILTPKLYQIQYQLKMKRLEFNKILKQLNNSALLPNTCLGSIGEQSAVEVLPAGANGYSRLNIVKVYIVVVLAVYLALLFAMSLIHSNVYNEYDNATTCLMKFNDH